MGQVTDYLLVSFHEVGRLRSAGFVCLGIIMFLSLLEEESEIESIHTEYMTKFQIIWILVSI